MTTDIEYIKTLLILNGDKRVVDLEFEIFNNDELTLLYLRLLTSSLALKEATSNNIQSMIYWYAKRVMETRWYAAERRLITNPHWIFYYSRDIIKGRWIEAEATISNDISYDIAYKDQFNIM